MESERYVHDMGDDNMSCSEAQPQIYPPQDNTSAPPEPHQSSSGKDKTRKSRSVVPVDILEGLVQRVGDVATSIKELKEETVDRHALLQAIMELQGEILITDSQISKVFDHLVKDDKLALGFLDRPVPLRKVWLVDFVMDTMGIGPSN